MTTFAINGAEEQLISREVRIEEPGSHFMAARFLDVACVT